MALSLLRQSSSYDPAAALTGKETEQDVVRMEFQAVSLENNGKPMESLQLMEKALQVRCRLCFSDAATPTHLSDACDAAERLITKSNSYGVKCFKVNEYETAEKLFSYAFEMTEEDSFPLREADDRRRYLRGVTLNNYGCMERSRGKFSEAFSYLQRSMECTGEQSPVAFLNMSAVQTQLRLCEQAADSAMRAMMSLGSSPEDSSLLAVAHHNLAMALELLDPPRAFEEYNSALGLAQTVIGRDSETARIIERNLNRFLRTSKLYDVGGRKHMTATSSSLASSRRNTSPHRLQDMKSPTKQSPSRSDEVDDIFPHPFLSTADDVVPRKFTVTSKYPQGTSSRKHLEPPVQKKTHSPNQSAPRTRHFEARKSRDIPVTTSTAPTRDTSYAREYGAPKVSRLQPMASNSRETKQKIVDSSAAGKSVFSGQPGKNRGSAGASGGFAAGQALSKSTGGKPSAFLTGGSAGAVKNFAAPLQRKERALSATRLSISATSQFRFPAMPSHGSVFAPTPKNASGGGLASGSPGLSVKKAAADSLRRDSIRTSKPAYAHSTTTEISFAGPKKSFHRSPPVQPSKTAGNSFLRAPLPTAATARAQPIRPAGNPSLRAPLATAATATAHTQPIKPAGNPSLRAPLATAATATAHTQPIKPAGSSSLRAPLPTATARAQSIKPAGNLSSRASAATATAHTQPIKPAGYLSSRAPAATAATATAHTQPIRPAGYLSSRAPAATAATAATAHTQPIRSFKNVSSRAPETGGDYTSRAEMGLDGKQSLNDAAAESGVTTQVSTRWQRKGGRLPLQAASLEPYMAGRLNMLLVDEEELDRKYACASVIQRAFRVYKARKLFRRLLEDRGRNHALREIREAIATRKLQRWFRKHFCLKWGTHQRSKGRYFISNTQHKAAIRIQKIARGWLDRRRFKWRKFYQENSCCAALAVQSWWRQIQAKVKLAKLKKLYEDAKTAAAQKERRELAAIVIQSSWRACIEERATREEKIKAQKLKQKIREACRRSAATRIQMWWRLLMARATFQRLKEAQAAREARLLEHQRRIDAATKLQALGRMIIAKRSTESLLTVARANAARAIREKLLENKAACKIQRACRLYYSKCLLKRLQKENRRRLQEARWGFFVTLAQRIGRGFFARKRLGGVLCEMEIRAREFSRKTQALESADRARKAILSSENRIAPVVERDEFVSAVVCQHPNGFLGVDDKPVLICDASHDARQDVENALDELRTVLTDTQRIVKDEATDKAQDSSPVLQFVPDVLVEERAIEEQETKDAPQHAEGILQSPFLVVSREQDVAEDEEKRLSLGETREVLLEKEEKEEPELVEAPTSASPIVNEGAIASQALPTNDAEELHVIVEERRRLDAQKLYEIVEERRRLGALSTFLDMREKEVEVPQAMESPMKEEQPPQHTECVEEKLLSEPSVKMDIKTRPVDTITRPEEPESCAEVTQPNSLEMALTVERELRKRAMAEEKRLREERNAICARANEYRLKKIAEAQSTEELRFFVPRPPLGRRRRDLSVPTPTHFVTSPSEKLLLQEQMEAQYLVKKEQSALTISRVARGYLDRRYAKAIRSITMEYVDYRVEMDREEPPILDYELLYQVTNMYSAGVEKARGVRHVTAVQAFLRALGSVRFVTERKGVARFSGTKISATFQPQRESCSVATLCGFVHIIRAKKELAVRKQAVLDHLETIRRLHSATSLRDFVKLLQAKKERLSRSFAVYLHLISEEKNAIFNEAVDEMVELLRLAEAEKHELICTTAAEEKRLLDERAAKKIVSFWRMCLAKKKLENLRKLVQNQRLCEIEVEEALDRAAMRVQRAYRSYKARGMAKEQRDAKKKHWHTLQAQDEELTAAMAAIVADAAENAGLWGASIGYYINEEEEAERDAEEIIQCVLVVQQMARGRLAQLHLQRLLRRHAQERPDAQ